MTDKTKNALRWLEAAKNIYLGEGTEVYQTLLEALQPQKPVEGGAVGEADKFFYSRLRVERQMIENRKASGVELKAAEYLKEVPTEVYERLVEFSMEYFEKYHLAAATQKPAIDGEVVRILNKSSLTDSEKVHDIRALLQSCGSGGGG
jgi:hypothetical protein